MTRKEEKPKGALERSDEKQTASLCALLSLTASPFLPLRTDSSPLFRIPLLKNIDTHRHTHTDFYTESHIYIYIYRGVWRWVKLHARMQLGRSRFASFHKTWILKNARQYRRTKLPHLHAFPYPCEICQTYTH